MGSLTFLTAVVLAHGLLASGESIPDFICPAKDGVYPHPTDCLSYYQCNEGIAVQNQCNAPLHFNPKTNNCDWPITEKCSKGEYDVAPGPGTWDPEEYEEIAPDEVKCPQHVCVCRVPHPCKCDVYCECRNGRPVCTRCPKGLHFNPSTQVCDHPKVAKCRPQPWCPTCPPVTTPTPCPTCPTCPPECEEGEIRPVGKDCKCFKKCVNGKWQKRCCPRDLYFSKKTKTCCFVNECEEPETCPCHCCLMPDKCDCTKYRLCQDGKETVMQCADGLVFDPVLETCNWPHNVNTSHCCDQGGWTTDPPPRTTTTRPQTTTPKPGEGICWRGDGHYRHPDCRKFYHCSNGYAYVKDCPAGLHWSVKADRCEWPDIAGCK